MNLNKGTTLTVTDRQGCTHSGYMTVPDDDVLEIVQLEGVGISAGDLGWLERAAAADASIFGKAARGEMRVVGNGLLLTSDGIFRDGVRLVRLEQVLTMMPVSDVARIWRTRRVGSASLAAAGAAGGVFLGLLSAAHLAFSPCGGSCADEAFLMGVSLVGIPVGLGVLGYKASQHDVEETIYRAP